MPFIGKQPAVGSFTLLDSITTSATATYALTKNGDAFYPETARNLLVSLNGVTQAPEDAYTVSGSNIIFDSALTSSDVIDYILVLGDVLDIGTPSDGTVGVPQMNSSLYTENEFFALPTGTTAQRPTSPADGYIRYNTTIKAVEIYHESSSSWEANLYGVVVASGGTETTITDGGVDYKVHTFTSSGTFTVTNGGNIEYLIVAGGGGGGGAIRGAGGGAGGMITGTSSVTNGVEYTITVGSGGASGAYSTNAGTNNKGIQGADSTGLGFTAIGGGFGQGGDSMGVGGSGGSGGGSWYPGYVGGSGTSGQGYDGGVSGSSQPYGSGGGGAGETGGNFNSGYGGYGGDGLESSINGTATYYAGGGSSSAYQLDSGYSGGLGGGGVGRNAVGTTVGISPSNGTANTGGGGGASGNGGSGIVIIRYPI